MVGSSVTEATERENGEGKLGGKERHGGKWK